MRLPEQTTPALGGAGWIANLRGVEVYLRHAGPNPLRFGEVIPAAYRAPAPIPAPRG